MKIKVTAQGLTPTIIDCEFNRFGEPHLKERNSASPSSFIFVNYSEMEKFARTRDKCKGSTYHNGKVRHVSIERLK